MKNYLIIGAVVLAGTIGFIIWNTQSSQKAAVDSDKPTNPQSNNTQAANTYNFPSPKKSAHYESNTPSHGMTLAGVPINVVIDFNFDLAKPSEIKINKDGRDFGISDTIIDSNNLAMRRAMTSDAPDGLYTVEYKACWPDNSCHDGNFQFAIDRSTSNNYSDQTGKKEVIIKLSQIKFEPQYVKISKGTKVIWVNDDNTKHYINSDSHYGHNYFPDQNSNLLEKGDKFNLTFTQTGIYPYHCSVHESSMTGSLLVE